ncbi:unnamed protein product [Sphenostylis stenocarpa]|uniref:Uncharacterized protein n=1 Tax=Sphenostylis stenocarpa TaxID=92480 RepID=A0AA86S8U1_9FABA|nr:unnamed protein product [Sphenostylis stenocarpa]
MVPVSLDRKDTEVRAYKTDPVQVRDRTYAGSSQKLKFSRDETVKRCCSDDVDCQWQILHANQRLIEANKNHLPFCAEEDNAFLKPEQKTYIRQLNQVKQKEFWRGLSDNPVTIPSHGHDERLGTILYSQQYHCSKEKVIRPFINHDLITGANVIHQTTVPVSLDLKDTEVRAYRTDPVQVSSSDDVDCQWQILHSKQRLIEANKNHLPFYTEEDNAFLKAEQKRC